MAYARRVLSQKHLRNPSFILGVYFTNPTRFTMREYFTNSTSFTPREHFRNPSYTQREYFRNPSSTQREYFRDLALLSANKPYRFYGP